jgi:hypothetical protein
LDLEKVQGFSHRSRSKSSTQPPLRHGISVRAWFKQKPRRLNSRLYSMKQSDDGLEVNFEFSDGKVNARKTFHFTKE